MPMYGDTFARRYSVVADTRRPWSGDEKQAIIADALQPGVNVSAVARRHGIKPNLLVRWRKLVASCGSAPLICEAIAQPPAPFHATPRGFAGPGLLAMILFEKFGQHQPLNRQSERYAREGVELSVSTLADQVGSCMAALQPLQALIEAHVLSTMPDLSTAVRPSAHDED
ncbi:transposase IS3/IS911 family protein [Rhodomicrobium vannielii ATCC 17100]|uniref:Transposase IS3/IS911 family protein n=1 Tax=Rhodomicrobium vannielii (strain ATCC 17100 / DSM 162 / LMG 4299 / NCIMB 10020 / ATH 3.1.1) TaxID=648757 RepID=E3I7T2_RHOVT|nr:transposase IS3/IS911 family protein [Rhodomicrobium vannielii ATCC 17100]